MQKCKHRPLDNGTPWGALRLVPLGHFHAFMALAVEWQLLAPTCDSLKNVLQPACMMSGRLRKSLYDYHFVFLTLLLWKLGSNRWHCGSFKVDQKSAIPYWYWDNNSTPAMIRFIAMHSSKQHTATPAAATPSPDESSTFKKPGHNLCAGSSTWLNGSHCGQRSSNSNRQPREVTPNGAAMHQISVGCVEKTRHISELQFVRNPSFRLTAKPFEFPNPTSLLMQASHIPLLPAWRRQVQFPQNITHLR